jgi:hypothetical protein
MFYPKSNTPGCTAQNCAIRDQYEKLSQYAVVFGISVDTPEAQANFAKQHNLKHIVLADTDGKVAEAYQVRTGAGFASRTTYRDCARRHDREGLREGRHEQPRRRTTGILHQARAHKTAQQPRKPPKSPKSVSASLTSPCRM